MTKPQMKIIRNNDNRDMGFRGTLKQAQSYIRKVGSSWESFRIVPAND